MGDLGTLLLLALPLVAIWLLIMRPAQRRQRNLATMRSQLQTGMEVMTTAGLYGTVRAIDGEIVMLEVTDGVVLRFAKGAIGSVVTGDDDSPPLGGLPDN